MESYERGADDAQSLLRLRKKYDLSAARCTTLLAPGSYQLVTVETPAVPAAEARAALAEKLKDSLDYPVGHATLDQFEIPARAQPAGSALRCPTRAQCGTGAAGSRLPVRRGPA